MMAFGCLMLAGGSVRADLAPELSDATSLGSVTAPPLQTQFSFSRSARLPVAPKVDSEPVTRVTLIRLGDSTTTAAEATITTFEVSDSGLIGDDDVAPWPSTRYDQNVQTSLNIGGSGSGTVSEVPVPGSVLLGLAGLGLAGFVRSRFSQT
jgi:hypothetical protein